MEEQTTTAETSEASVSAPAPESNTGLGAETPSQEAVPDGLGSDVPNDSCDQDGAAPTMPDTIGAPDGDYSTDGIELPDGAELSPGTLSELGNVCRGLNLSQKTFSEIVEKMAPVLQKQQESQVETLRTHLLEQGRSDPEIGGAKWNETMRDANRAYAKFVDADTQKLLAATGLNCHPGLIRMFRNISKLISDDAVVRGQRQSSKPDPLANFYDNSNMNR